MYVKNFMLFYADAGSSDFGSVVFSAKNLNSAFASAKRFCKEYNKTFLGVIDCRFTSKYMSL